eukprot:gene30715-39569_t
MNGPAGSQAFWIWFTLGIMLLGLETFLGTQWLLWSATAAGLVSVICLTGLPFGFVLQVIVFAILSLIMTALTRRFMKHEDGQADINDPHLRLVGKQAEILSGFGLVAGGERTGRVVSDGVEWPAVLDEEQPDALSEHTQVTIIK